MNYERIDNISDGTGGSSLRIVGRVAMSGSLAAPFDVWDLGTVWPGAQSPAAVSVVSSSVQDDVGGSGISDLVVVGLRQDYSLAAVGVVMDGTTPVLTELTDFIAIDELRPRNTSTGAIAVGNITASIGGVAMGRINAGFQQSFTAPRYIPISFVGTDTSNHGQGILAEVAASLTSESTGQLRVNVAIDVRPDGAQWRTVDLVNIQTTASGTYYSRPVYLWGLDPRGSVRARVIFREGAAGILTVNLTIGDARRRAA